MADTRYLKRRHQGWYFQIAVPRAVREAYGSDVISVTLETRDLSIAQQRRWPKLVEYQGVGGTPKNPPIPFKPRTHLSRVGAKKSEIKFP